MTLAIWVVIVILVVAVLLSRSVYTLLVPGAIDRDAYAHMLYTRDIKRNGHTIPDHPQQVETSGTYAYPFLLHWVLSFFPLRWLPAIDRFFSPLIDVVFALLLIALVPLGVGDPWGVAFGLAVFLFTPQFVRPDLPNAIGLSSRKPGLVLTTAGLLAFTVWLSTESAFALVAALSIGAMVFLLSKFSAQALLFGCLGLSVVAPVAFAYFAVSAVLAVVVSGGEYLRVARSHLAHLYEYALIKQQKIFEPVRWNILVLLGEIDTLDDLLRATYNNRIVRPLVNNPYAIALGVTVVAQETTETTLDVPGIYYVWIGACVAAFVLTSLPYMLFLGKAERYLEYAFVPSVVVLAEGWRAFGTPYRVVVGAVLAGGIAVVAVYVWAYPRFFFSSEDEQSWVELTETLSGFDPATVVVQPFWGARRVAWTTDHSVVDFVMNEGTTPNAESDALCPERYAVITSDTGWLADQYGPDWVVFDMEKADEVKAAGGLTPPGGEPVFENGRFELYRFDAF